MVAHEVGQRARKFFHSKTPFSGRGPSSAVNLCTDSMPNNS
jgi:hypothetical protein